MTRSADLDRAACQRCQHWAPLFRGDPWGVRSFADAPLAEQTRIRDYLERRAHGEEPPEDAIVAEREEQLYERGGQGVDRTDPDWPMWGRCELTEIGSDAKTLARAVDGSDYYAVLHTRANFGCVQFAELRKID